MSRRKPHLVNAAPQSGHISPLPWRLEEDAYGTNIMAGDGSRVAYVHSCSCNAQADADAELLVSAPALKVKVGVLEEERRSLLGNLEDQTNATAAQKRRADELLEVLEAIGAMPEGFCACPILRDATRPDAEHVGECREARVAIRAARGGA